MNWKRFFTPRNSHTTWSQAGYQKLLLCQTDRLQFSALQNVEKNMNFFFPFLLWTLFALECLSYLWSASMNSFNLDYDEVEVKYSKIEIINSISWRLYIFTSIEVSFYFAFCFDFFFILFSKKCKIFYDFQFDYSSLAVQTRIINTVEVQFKSQHAIIIFWPFE